MSAVSIKNVSKEFKGGTTALENIDLEIEEREFVSLIGPSGCGKSTLLRVIGDLIEPTSGEVTVNGEKLSAGDAMKLWGNDNAVRIEQGRGAEVLLFDLN